MGRVAATVSGRQRSPRGAGADCRTRRGCVTDFYGIQAGTIPGFAQAGGGIFMSVMGLPDRTVRNMITFMDELRGMQAQDPRASKGCLGHVASVIEDQRRKGVIPTRGTTPPVDTGAPLAHSASSVS